MKKTDWIQTYTGKKFYPLEPDADLICIEDIAHSLSMQCRYNGHSDRFYSVAQHSVILSQKFFQTPQMRLAALLHDASEAYLSDVPRPIKHMPEMKFYRDAEHHLQNTIFRKFGVALNGAELRYLKFYDDHMISHEAHQLMYPIHEDWQLERNLKQPFKIDFWTPSLAKSYFLTHFEYVNVMCESASAAAA